MMTYSEIREYANNHPKNLKGRTLGDLTIFKYTKRTHFNNEWSDNTLVSRGLVLNEKDELVSFPFTKFFNEGEPLAAVFNRDETVYAVRKYNGFLAIVTLYKGELLVHTAGSLEGEFVEKIKRYVKEEWKNILNPNMTYMFECVTFDDYHVTKEREGLTLIGYREKSFGSPIHFYYEDLKPLADKLGCHCAEGFMTTFKEIKEKVKDVDFEGYVVYDPNPYHNKCLKLKSPTFLFKRFLAYVTEKSYNKLVVDETVDEEFIPIINYFNNNKDFVLSLTHEERVKLVRAFFEKE